MHNETIWMILHSIQRGKRGLSKECLVGRFRVYIFKGFCFVGVYDTKDMD